MSQSVLNTLDLLSRYVFLVIMPLLGIFLLIAGSLKVGNFKVKGVFVQIIGIVFILVGVYLYFFVHRGFLYKYSILLQAVILLLGFVLLWFMAEKPVRHQPLAAELTPTNPVRMNLPIASTCASSRMVPESSSSMLPLSCISMPLPRNLRFT